MNGVLPDSDIRKLIDSGAITATPAIIPEQIQPASLDLRLGTTAYRLRASFLTGRGRRVMDRLADVRMHQMDLPGGVIAFRTPDPQAMSRQLAARLRVAHYAFSLGHQRSIVTLLDTAEMIAGTYRLSGEGLADYRRFAGDGLFRLSVGLEAEEDLIADLDQALAG